MAVTLTSKVFWQLTGHRLPDGTKETRNAEVFSGIGFYARPNANHRAEAVVIMPSGASQPIVVASRDEDARKAIANIAADETAMFNSATIILIKADGTVEIRTAAGTALNLATKQDLDILRGAIASAAIALGAGGAATINAAADTAYAGLFPGQVWPRGTKKLKGE